MSSWYLDKNTDFGICVTSRVRLARNINGYPFPSKMQAEDFLHLCSEVKNAVTESNLPLCSGLKFIKMDDVPETEIMAMVERHIISPEFAENCSNKAVIISEDESICIMIGEEDHIRIQVLYPGMALDKAYETANTIDEMLEKKLRFAFSEQLGYLTECATNIGTGLRASVMLHLPMLSSSREISVIGDSVSKIGFTVRGMYGEAGGSGASLWQLSNQITLGISEKDAINNLKTLASQIIEKEKSAISAADPVLTEDSVFRAYGILKNARTMSSKEMMNCVSLIKLGTYMGILDIGKDLPVKILIETKPYMLMRAFGNMDARERDIKRAEVIRNLLN